MPTAIALPPTARHEPVARLLQTVCKRQRSLVSHLALSLAAPSRIIHVNKALSVRHGLRMNSQRTTDKARVGRPSTRNYSCHVPCVSLAHVM